MQGQRIEVPGTLGPVNRCSLNPRKNLRGKSQEKGYYLLVTILKGLGDLQEGKRAVGSAQKGDFGCWVITLEFLEVS